MFKRILSKYLLLWLVLVCILGFYWTTLFGEKVLNPFKLSGDGMAWLISLTMLAVGSLLPPEEVRGVAKNWSKVLGGTCVQYISMPLLAFCSAKFFHLEGGYFIGVMLAGCVPGAMASNILTLTARGNVSYSVGLTTSATLLSPLVVPWTLWVFFRDVDVDINFHDMMLGLLLTVVFPVVVGFTLSSVSKLWRKGSEIFAEILANFAIIWIISSVVAMNGGKIAKLTGTVISALMILNFAGYLAGYLGGMGMRLTPAMRRALTIEVGMQNAGLGTTLATMFFKDQPEAALVCAAYTFGCMATGVILAQCFRIDAERAERREESKKTTVKASGEGTTEA